MSSKFKRETVAKLTLDNRQCDVQAFESYENLSNFCIDFDSALIESKPFPKLEENFLQNRRNLAIDLGHGFETNLRLGKLITNYDKYRTEKWEHFLRVLQKKEVLDQKQDRIDFVSSSGQISDMFTNNNWVIFALKYHDVIYLFKEKTLEFDPNKSGNATKKGFYGLKFLYSITDRDESELNQFEKYFGINRFEFKGHRLIVCSEVDAIDSNGELIEAKCRQKWDLKHPNSQKIILKHKKLEDWSQCLVNNAKTMVIGYRNENILMTTEVVSVDSIPGMCGQYWKPSTRFGAVDQILKAIKNCVESEDQLYGFEYRDNNRSLFCFKYNSREDNPTLFLPDWYRKTTTN